MVNDETRDGADRVEVAVGLRNRLRETEPFSVRTDEPVSCGVPFPPAIAPEGSDFHLLDPRSRRRPVQTRVLDRWSDGSVRWLLVDFLASSEPAGEYKLVLSNSEDSDSAIDDADAQVMRASLDRGRARIETGPAVFELSLGERFPFASVTVAGRPVLDADSSGLFAEEPTGERFRATTQDLSIQEQGSIHTAVVASGRLETPSDSEPLADFSCVLHFYAGKATVRMDLTVTNPRPAGHPGGLWSLGSEGAVLLRSASLDLVLTDPADCSRVWLSESAGMPLNPCGSILSLYQESSGGDNWRSPIHVNRSGVVPMELQGYRLESDDVVRTGRRATPSVAIRGKDIDIGFCSQYFWQDFPKSIEATAARLRYGLFPSQSTDPHELQGGEQKTHTFHLAFERDSVSPESLEWCRRPMIFSPDPDWYSSAQAAPFLLPADRDNNQDYLELVEESLSGTESLFAKREKIDEYGWRHFGDIYADHEAAFHDGSEPLVSHYNNQYDAINGFAVQFMRTTDERWYRLMAEHAAHSTDVDIYHTDGDKSAYNGGLFWHTVHYTDAHTGTHRSYPDLPGVGGGGPSAGHLYTTGLMLHHFMTGNPGSRRAVSTLGRYVIDADDGRKSRFRLLDSGFTGHASSSGFDDFHGPGRSPANAINAQLDAYRVTSEEEFLEKAEQLIRRCIHPDDDLQERRLLDAERRWYYTMFLRSLGKYLEVKAERQQNDFMVDYAWTALRRYAEWTCAHEYPYLQKPEILEFPTETWAAQDLRKGWVFNMASRFCGEETRGELLQQARFFFDDAVRRLKASETRSYCRPVVLLLTLGYVQGYFDTRAPKALPERGLGKDSFDKPQPFVPQKRRVKKKLAAVAAAGLILGIAIVGFLVGVLTS